MELLAGSVNVDVDEFLHAGYLSASPRSLEQFGWFRYSDEASVEVVDLASAVALKPIAADASADLTAKVSESRLPRSPWPAASLSSDLLMLGVVVFFFGAIAVAYLRRLGSRSGRRLYLYVAGPAAMLVIVAAVLIGAAAYRDWQLRQLNSLPPPWLDVPVREYEDPELATRAILQGLIVPGLNGCSFDVQNLAAIQNEVAWPLDRERWTEGMTYAATCYGRDGWGSEFQFAALGDGAYGITSAGADGEFGTADDIAHTTPQKDHYNWEPQVASFYVRSADQRSSDQEVVFLVHRVAHRNFLMANARARELTGSELFDAVPDETWLPERDHWVFLNEAMAEIKNFQESRALAAQDDSPGLLLVLLSEKDS